MYAVLCLTKRNMLMYLKDRGAVFFSLLSPLIIILLYMLFLAKMNIDGVQNTINASRQLSEYLVNSWVMGGILASSSVTVTLGVMGIMIEDEAKKRLAAFLSAPVGRFKLVLGYVLSSFLIGNVLCILTFFLSETYIYLSGGSLLPAVGMIKVIAVIIASVFSSTCFIFLLVSFIHTMNTYSTVSILLGTLIGFAAGVYIPVGMLPGAVGNIIKYLPVFCDASLIRDIYMAGPVTAVFKGAPADVASGYLEYMGVNLSWGGSAVSGPGKLMIVLASGTVFLILSFMVLRRRRPSV